MSTANTNLDITPFRDPARSTSAEKAVWEQFDQYIQTSIGSYFSRLENFAKYVPRQSIARFLALYEIFKKTLNVHGDIIEGGVTLGGGLMTLATMSTILEPYNLNRRIIGFDTFEGFVEPSPADQTATSHSEVRAGGYAVDSFDDLQRAIDLFDGNRLLNHIRTVSLVRGDAKVTIPEYLADHPHTVVSLLHLDFDLYEPTKAACEHLLPRMPKGAVVIFDELNNSAWPGETVAVSEAIGISQLRIQRFPFEPHLSYAVIE